MCYNRNQQPAPPYDGPDHLGPDYFMRPNPELEALRIEVGLDTAIQELQEDMRAYPEKYILDPPALL